MASTPLPRGWNKHVRSADSMSAGPFDTCASPDSSRNRSSESLSKERNQVGDTSRVPLKPRRGKSRWSNNSELSRLAFAENSAGLIRISDNLIVFSRLRPTMLP